MQIRVGASDSNSLYRMLSLEIGSKSIVTPTIGVKDILTREGGLWGLKNKFGPSFILENYIALNRFDISDDQLYQNKKLMNLSNQLMVPLLTIFEIPTTLLEKFDTRRYALGALVKKIKKDITADIIATPYVKWLRGKYNRLRNQYLRFYKFFIEESSDFGGVRSIVLQNIATNDLEEIMGLCIDNGIDFIVLDFGASTVYSYKDFVSKILSHFDKVSGRNAKVFYGLNINRGRAGRGSNEFSARDIVAFGYGIDILGTKRIGAVSRDRPPSLSMYFLDINDYCYRLGGEASSDKDKKYLEEKKNAFSKMVEATRIRELLLNNENVIDYLKRKRCIDKRDLDSIVNWRRIVSYTSEVNLAAFFEE